jgi:heptosyltransferase-2
VTAAEPHGTRNAERGTLVVQTAYLGDLVLTLPLLQRLAARFGPVDVVTTPVAAPLLAGEPAVRRVIPYDKRGTDRGVLGLLRLAARLRAEGYARAFLPHRSLRTALLARLAGIPERTGFTGGLAGRWHTARVERPAAGHESSRLAALAGPAAPPAAPWLTLTRESRRTAQAWLDAHGIGSEFIILAPGARWATKRWPYFPELASTLALPVVVIGGPEDREVGAAVVRAAPDRSRNAAGDLTLPESAAVIDRAALVVSNDSVALHLAGALARPVVVVAGPTGPASGFAPLSPADPVVALPGLACRPCSLHGQHRCPLGHHRCMVELGVDRVAAAVVARLAAIRTGPPRNAAGGTGSPALQ